MKKITDRPSYKKRLVSKCIFCGYVGPLTGEHIISRRYHRYIPRTTRHFSMLRSVEHLDHSKFLVSNRSTDPLDWKVQCVCDETCNNGWMRSLEDKAEHILIPLITGQPLRLSTEDQAMVTAWAAMKAMVAEYSDPDMASVHHTHRKMLFRKQILPVEGWAVWIGYYPRETWVPIYHSTPFLYLTDEKLAKRSTIRATYYNASITTQAIGELLVQVIHAPKPFHLSKWRYPTFPNGGTLRRIWPPSWYSVSWPSAAMSERDTDLACKALRNHISSGPRKRSNTL